MFEDAMLRVGTGMQGGFYTLFLRQLETVAPLGDKGIRNHTLNLCVAVVSIVKLSPCSNNNDN
jgi:hypothetical protein